MHIVITEYILRFSPMQRVMVLCLGLKGIIALYHTVLYHKTHW